MTRTLLTTENNPSDNLSCPHCNTQLPPQALFCSSCGKQVVQEQNEGLESGTEHASNKVQDQEAETTRLDSLSHIYLKRWLSYQSQKNNMQTSQSKASRPTLQHAEVLTQPFSSSRKMASADTPTLLVTPIPKEPAQSSPTNPAESLAKAWEWTSGRSNWLWPTVIILSAVASGLVYFVLPDTMVRPAVAFWFLFVCPGMAVIRFLHLKEPVVEWVLALTLSFAIDALVAAIQLYTGRWSPAGTLILLMIISLSGAIVQLATSTKSVPLLLHTMRSRKPSILLPILLTLLVGIIVGASLWFYEVYHGSGSPTSTSALRHNTTSHSSTTSTSSAHITTVYHGTITDIPTNLTTNMSLTGIQQTQITIGGNFTGLHRTGIFNGKIGPSKHLQFTVKDSAGHLMLSFDGNMQSDGNLSGSYCSVDQNAQCTSEYGIWSVAPAS